MGQCFDRRSKLDFYFEVEEILHFSEELSDILYFSGMLAMIQVYWIQVVRASQHTLQRFHDEGILAETGIDLLFMDHDEALYEPDVKLAEKLGFLDKEGALVIADNVLRPGAPEYRSYMRKNLRLSKSWGLPGFIVPGDFEVSCLACARSAFCLKGAESFAFLDNSLTSLMLG